MRYCSKTVLQKSALTYNFTDACWVKAGEAVEQLLGAEPFQRGFLGTPAQQGAGSSAGLIGNGKAAMELQGHWNPGVMNGLSPNQKGIGKNLGWFPFPAVPGAQGRAGRGARRRRRLLVLVQGAAGVRRLPQVHRLARACRGAGRR